MTHAAITGWGKCLPPATLTNADLATIIDTNDDWIVQRTGIRERRITHVPAVQLTHVAAQRALACAGIEAGQLDLIVYGSCSADEAVPNTASGLQVLLGAKRAAAYDINTACTSFLYGLSTATALIKTGVVRTALVVGVEYISQYMDWSNRNVAVLFGDGAAAVVLQASDREEGLIGEALGCIADARQTLRVRGMGAVYGNRDVMLGDTQWDFDGQEIFKRAVHGMSEASNTVLAKCGKTIADIDLLVPHQANLRIIEAVGKRIGASMDRTFLTVHKYGNMSAATVPVALVEAIEAGRVQPGNLLLMPAFGAGLTLCSHLVRWGERVTPIATSDAELPPFEGTALDLVGALRAKKEPAGRSAAGSLPSPLASSLMVPVLPR